MRHDRLLFVLAVAVLGGCGGAPAGSPDGGTDVAPADAGMADAALEDAGDGGGDDARPTCAVTEESAPGADWACATPESCRADYDAFAALAAASSRPITDVDLLGELWDLQNGSVPEVAPPVAADALRTAIIDGLNVGFLLGGLCERPLRVVVSAVTDAGDHVAVDLLLVDPWVGTVKGILLLPAGSGPFPAVVAIHGHGDSAAVYRDSYHGAEWPARGYAILMLTMRVMGIDLDEHEVTHDLLLSGFNLVGLRVYETLLGLKYLRSRPEVDPDRVGLIGHSGGSSASNLTVRLEPAVRAYVSDCTVDWFKSSDFELYHCETAPALFPYHEVINDFATASVPVKAVPYGYTNGMAEIFAFFDQNL